MAGTEQVEGGGHLGETVTGSRALELERGDRISSWRGGLAQGTGAQAGQGGVPGKRKSATLKLHTKIWGVTRYYFGNTFQMGHLYWTCNFWGSFCYCFKIKIKWGV